MSNPFDIDTARTYTPEEYRAMKAAQRGSGTTTAAVATAPAPSQHSGDPRVQHVREFRDRIIGEMKLRAELGDEAAGGEMLGFRELDEELNIEAGRLIVLAAREGVGKTALGLQCARTIALRGGEALYAITEMSAIQTVQRVIAGFAQVEARKMRRGVTEDVVAAAERAFDLLDKSGLHIVNVAGRNIDEIVRVVRGFRAEHPNLRAVFVDNLTGINPSQVRRTQGSHEYIGEIVEKLNTLAQPEVGVGVPVFLLGHLGRPEKGREDRKPYATDLAGSDKVNRFADTIILLHKVDQDGQDPEGHAAVDPFAAPSRAHDTKRTHEVLVPKNRDGRTFTCDLTFVGSQLRFVDPKGPTVRPYEMPAPESAVRSMFRERIRALDLM